MGPPKVCSPAERNGQADRPGSTGFLAGARPGPPMQAEAQTSLLVIEASEKSVIPALALRFTDLARELPQPLLLMPMRELRQKLPQLACFSANATNRRCNQNLRQTVNQAAGR